MAMERQESLPRIGRMLKDAEAEETVGVLVRERHLRDVALDDHHVLVVAVGCEVCIHGHAHVEGKDRRSG